MTSLRPSAAGRRGSGGARDQTPEAVRVWLLGDFRVSVGSRTIESDGWRLKKAAALVKLLALSPGRRAHRERVMDLLWPDLGRWAAANNLRHALHVARRAFDPAPDAAPRYLRLAGQELALCPDGPLWVDVEAFEEAALTARSGGEPAAYRAAVELYTGELLPEDRYEDWVEGRRRELRATYLALLLELAELYEERGEYGRGIEVLRRAVAEEPTREEAHAGLIRLYALSGRRGEALRQYQVLEETLVRELGAEPGEESRRLQEGIRSGRVPVGGRPSRSRRSDEGYGAGLHNLPVPRGSFVGRERDAVEIKRLLSMTGLLNLTGAGGSGKTRLALEVARELVGSYADGVWFVELAPLSEPELVPQAVAAALAVCEQPGRPLKETLVEHLRDERTLLILDNCEHLVDAAASLVDALLSSCPRLRVLATSREPLGVAGEVNWRVPPLSVPDAERLPPAEDLACYESVRLFVERARARLPAFEITPENARSVAEVCRRLDGIPLAIELATARLAVLAVEQVADRLEESLKLLTGGTRTAAPRQQTMRATLEWSHELLSEPEKKLFGRLSVFAGGWTLEAAEAVGMGDGIGRDDVLDLLNGLIDKSLVVAEASSGVETLHATSLRYRMLEPVRQYARERLEESGEAGEVRSNHAAFFRALAEVAEPELRGAEQAVWLERLEREHDNMRAALSWSLESGEGELGLRLAGALGDFWHARGHLNEGRRWLKEALAKGDASSASARVRALAHAGYLAWEQIDYERATALSEEGLALSRESGDKAGTAAALYVLGAVAMFQTRFEDTSTLFEEALALWRELEDTSGVARTLQGLGLVAVARHDYERAMAIHEESLTLAREAGDNLGVILALGQGALAAVGRGEHDLAGHLCAEGLELARGAGHPHAIMFILNVGSVLATARGQPVRSARMWGAAAALGQTIGITGLSPVEQHHYGPYIAAARSELGDAAWEAALAEGRATKAEEAIEYALGTRGAYPVPAPGKPERCIPGSGAGASRMRAKALNQAGYLTVFQGEYETAKALLEEALALFRELEDEEGIASALTNLGFIAVFAYRELDTVAPLLDEATSLRPKIEDRRTVAMMLVLSGLLAGSQGDLQRAEADHEEALELFRETGDLLGVCMCTSNLGLTALARADYERARALLEENLHITRELDHRVSAHYSFFGLAGVAARRNLPARAAKLWGAAETLRETSGLYLTPLARAALDYDRDQAAARAELGEAAWEAAWAEGKAMTHQEAIEYALGTVEPPSSGAETSPLEAKVLNKAGKLAWEQGDYPSAKTSHEESLRLHRQAKNKPGIALSLSNLGLLALYQGDYASATALHEESLALRRELQDKRGTASSLHNLGLAAMYQGSYARAEAFFKESLFLSRELGDPWLISTLLNNLGLMVLHQGNHERASEFQKESLSLRRELRDRGGIAECLEGFSGIAAAQNYPPRAARLWSAAEAVRETIGAPPPPGHRSLYETYLAAARARTDQTAWEAARSEGRTMTLDEAVAYALSEEEPAAAPVAEEPPVGTQSSSLTRREREVAALVARGLTNRRVAEELSISERTVETHVRNILGKLGLKSRVELAESSSGGDRG